MFLISLSTANSFSLKSASILRASRFIVFFSSLYLVYHLTGGGCLRSAIGRGISLAKEANSQHLAQIVFDYC